MNITKSNLPTSKTIISFSQPTILSDKNDINSKKINEKSYIDFYYNGKYYLYPIYKSLTEYLKVIAESNKESEQGSTGLNHYQFEIVVLDIDDNVDENYLDLINSDLPKPSFVLLNNETNHLQIQWLLDKPQFYDGDYIFYDKSLDKLKEEHYDEEFLFSEKYHYTNKKDDEDYKKEKFKRNVQIRNHKSYNTECFGDTSKCIIPTSNDMNKDRTPFNYIIKLINLPYGDLCYHGPQCKNPYTHNSKIKRLKFDENLRYDYNYLLEQFKNLAEMYLMNNDNDRTETFIRYYKTIDFKKYPQFIIDYLGVPKFEKDTVELENVKVGKIDSTNIINNPLYKRNDTVLRLACFYRRKFYDIDNVEEVIKHKILEEDWYKIQSKNSDGIYTKEEATRAIDYVLNTYNSKFEKTEKQVDEVRIAFSHIVLLNKSYEKYKKIIELESKLISDGVSKPKLANKVCNELNIKLNTYYKYKKFSVDNFKRYINIICPILLKKSMKEVWDYGIKHEVYFNVNNLLKDYFSVCKQLQKSEIWNYSKITEKTRYYLTVEEFNYFIENLSDEEIKQIESQINLIEFCTKLNMLSNVSLLVDENIIINQARYDRSIGFTRKFEPLTMNSITKRNMSRSRQIAMRNKKIYQKYYSI